MALKFEALTPDQVLHIKNLWDLEGDISFHRNVANSVYFARSNHRDIIIRVTAASHRSQKELESELHWMSFLADHNLKVAQPIKNVDSEYVAELKGNTLGFVSAFEKAPGTNLKFEKSPTDLELHTWGRYLGRLHALTKSYKPPPHILPRGQWHQDEVLTMGLRARDGNDPLAFERLDDCVEWMQSLQKDENSYGLVHCDLHTGNFFVENGEITAFDFDDSSYHWFSYDIAVALQAIFFGKDPNESTPQMKEDVLHRLMIGYSKENTLDDLWTKRILVFERCRTIMIYHWVKTNLKEGLFNQSSQEWAATALPKMKFEIDKPITFF